ncbi:helix-turn-helix domain-containing protein [Rhodopseudomonas pseudopalustris]|uniref:helix-turn-helix domain-containing protein n=1 Tax=Rhodopseudomonas pseudopalustris TaxID=1513892 RepID=UPI000B88A116
MTSSGWHRADIVAAFRKRGTSLAEVARKHELCDSALRAALTRPRSPSNRIIANFLEVPLHVLWPRWFDRTGNLIARDARPDRQKASSQKRSRKLNRVRA